MIRLIVSFVLISLILRSVVRLMRGVAEGLSGPKPPRSPKAVPLVRDPVCGTYVVPASALTSGAGGQLKYFCSENCRRAYAMKIAQ